MLHVPVLLAEVVDWVQPKSGGVYLDATFGGGGYTKALLQHDISKIFVIDRDPEAIDRAKNMDDKRIQPIQGSFSDIDKWFDSRVFDGVVFDFGVSSFQLEAGERGFSFRLDGPLDMRMAPDADSLTAADIVNTWREEDLANLIYQYGQETRSRIIAKAIVAERRNKPFQTTLELAEVIRSVIKRYNHIDPCTLTFQALRIYVNNELMEIDRVLKKARFLIKNGGRIVTVSFHELEDRIVKYAFRDLYTPLHKKAVLPSDGEIKSNPRARSGRLRAAEVTV